MQCKEPGEAALDVHARVLVVIARGNATGFVPDSRSETWAPPALNLTLMLHGTLAFSRTQSAPNGCTTTRSA
jgi:hypothetical protein